MSDQSTENMYTKFTFKKEINNFGKIYLMFHVNLRNFITFVIYTVSTSAVPGILRKEYQ